MKISGKIIQNRNIRYHTETMFEAIYKGRWIWITSEHGFGKPKMDHLTRYRVAVTDEKTGMYDVDTYGDYHTMTDAIRYALKGACLLDP